MFHILVKNSTPNHLVGGPWTSVRPESHSDVPASTVECGRKGGTIREAITQEEFKSLQGQGKLNKSRVCINCFKSVEGYRPREVKEVKNGEV